MTLSQDEIAALYERYGSMVFRRCRNLVGNEEEAFDLMQEVFLRLVQNAAAFRGEASPLTWLYRVSTNLCLNRLRDGRSRARKLATPDPAAESVPGMGAFVGVDPDRRRLVSGLLEHTDDATRAIVVHYFVDEMTLEEISAVVGLSIPTLRKRIQGFQGQARRATATPPLSSWLVLFGLLQGGVLSPGTPSGPADSDFVAAACPSAGR